MTRHHWLLGAAVGLAGLSFCGCDWSSGGDGNTWSDRYNWVNFSGVYRGIGGGKLVTDYTATAGTPGVTNAVTNEQIDTGEGNDPGSPTAYSGTISKRPIVAGSLTITAMGYTFTDNGSGALIGSIGGTGGSINYGTGSWSINLNGGTLNVGAAVRATYRYTVAGTAGSGSAGSGATGITIYSFVVEQRGNVLVVTDNNGSVYNGKFGSVRTTGGSGADSPLETANPTVGTEVIAQFSASGTSKAGKKVTMTGTFQGVVGVGSLNDRRMLGTWIESKGKTGDISGQASPIGISTTTTTTGG